MTTYVPEFSYEAVTLDYLSPLWYPLEKTEAGEAKGFATEAEAQAALDAWYEGLVDKMVARRVRTVTPVTDEFLEAEFAANAQFWADRARLAQQAEQARREIFALRGRTVEVVKGRKVPKGTRGEVFWVGESQWGGYRVGLKTAEGETHWTAEANVALVEEVSA